MRLFKNKKGSAKEGGEQKGGIGGQTITYNLNSLLKVVLTLPSNTAEMAFLSGSWFPYTAAVSITLKPHSMPNLIAFCRRSGSVREVPIATRGQPGFIRILLILDVILCGLSRY